MAEPALLVWREQPVGVAAMRLQPSTRSIAYDVFKEIAGLFIKYMYKDIRLFCFY